MQSHLLQCTGQPATTAKNDPVENVHSSEVDNHGLWSSIQEHLLCRTEKPSRSAEMQTCKNGKQLALNKSPCSFLCALDPC